MKEQASTRPPPDPASNGADSDRRKLEELRRLLWGDEQAQLSRLEERLDNPDVRAEEISRILAHAKIRKSLRAVLKRDSDLVVEALKPVILRSVRQAVTDALRELTESLNQIAEKSVSPRALQWRFEAWRTGKNFSDIVLSRSLLYSVRQVFLIHRKTGVLLQQATKQAITKDADMVTSMLTAIQDFATDSFAGNENKELETLDFGSFKLWIQDGTYARIAGAIDGSPPVGLKGVFRGAIDEIEEKFVHELSSFQGDVAPFDAARPILERCLLGESSPKPRRSLLPWWVVAIFVLIVVGIAAWVTLAFIQHQRWERYLERLRGEHGIVVTRAEKEGSHYVVAGLRDDLASNPLDLLKGTGLSKDDVTIQFDRYQSDYFATEHRLDTEKTAIEQSVIRFQTGKSDLVPAEQDHLDEIVSRWRTLTQAATLLQKTLRIEVIGHTDQLGTEQENARLSQDRADQVVEYLVSDGLNRSLVTTRGVATFSTRPQRHLRPRPHFQPQRDFADNGRTMKRLAWLSLVASLPLLSADAHMTAEERTKVLNWLEESRKEFLAAIDGVTEEQWKWKPTPERWSVGETAEHIVLAEALLFGNVQNAVASPVNPDWAEQTKGKTEFIVQVMAPRLGKAKAPEPIVPTGKLTQAEVRAQFEKQRIEIVKFAADTDVPLKEYTVQHPFPVFGTLNAYQWLIYVPLHTMRHDKQIAEVKATPGYPK